MYIYNLTLLISGSWFVVIKYIFRHTRHYNHLASGCSMTTVSVCYVFTIADKTIFDKLGYFQTHCGSKVQQETLLIRPKLHEHTI